VSFDLNEARRLKVAGDPVWSEYCRLVAECDASAYDSPAHRVLGEFQKAWERGPNELIERVRQLNVARAEAAEAARRAG
jgi:hypothetical protein